MSNPIKRYQKSRERVYTAKAQPRILIGVPSNRDLPKEFVAGLLPLAVQVGIENVIFMTNNMINQCRDAIVKVAIDKDYDYILWLDDDMIIPPDALSKLLAHDKDICSGLYFGRGNYKPLMYDINKDNEGYYSIEQIKEYQHDDLMKVGAVGFGCCLTKVSALKKIWNDPRDGVGKTCFDFIGGVGEDISFGFRCLECGIDTWVDTSIMCGHLGKITVNENMWLAVKDIKS